MVGTDQPILNYLSDVARRYAEAGRRERGLSGDRLGHGGAAPCADQAAGRRRLELVLHRLLRAGFLHAGEPPAAAGQRQERLVRLAGRSEDRGAAGRLVQCAGPRRAEEGRRGHAASGVRERAVLPAWFGAAPTAFRPEHHRACRRASRSSGTCAAPDGGHRRRRHRHLRRGGATGRAAQHHAAPARRGGRRVRCAFCRSAVRADRRRRPIRTVGGFGDGGNAGSAWRAAGAHPAGGNRHRHAVLGARGRGTAADAWHRGAGVRRQQPVPSAALSAGVAADGRSARAQPSRCCRPRRTGGVAAIGGCARCRRFRTTRCLPCGGGSGDRAAATAPFRRNPAPPRSPGRSRRHRPPDRPCPR